MTVLTTLSITDRVMGIQPAREALEDFQRIYEQVCDINAAAGNRPVDLNDTEAVASVRARQLALIVEETDETVVAVLARDLDGLRDGVCDMLVTVHGMFYLALPHDNIRELASLTIEKDVLTDFNKVAHRMRHLQNAIHQLKNVDPSDEEFEGGMAMVTTLLHALVDDLPFDVNQDMDEVYRSNMTKFDTSEDDYRKTVSKYHELGVELKLRKTQVRDQEYFVAISAYTQTDKNGKSIREGKFLKSYRFEEPVFAPLPPALVRLYSPQ